MRFGNKPLNRWTALWSYILELFFDSGDEPMKYLVSILTTLAVLTGCASQRLTNEDRETLYQNYLAEIKAEPLERITAFRFYGWRELGNRHLIISTSYNRNYFITLRGTCIELQYSHTIGINRSDSSLNAKFDSIFVPSFPEQRCHIKSIHKITREQADRIDDLEEELLAKKIAAAEKT